MKLDIPANQLSLEASHAAFFLVFSLGEIMSLVIDNKELFLEGVSLIAVDLGGGGLALFNMVSYESLFFPFFSSFLVTGRVATNCSGCVSKGLSKFFICWNCTTRMCTLSFISYFVLDNEVEKQCEFT